MLNLFLLPFVIYIYGMLALIAGFFILAVIGGILGAISHAGYLFSLKIENAFGWKLDSKKRKGLWCGIGLLAMALLPIIGTIARW